MKNKTNCCHKYSILADKSFCFCFSKFLSLPAHTERRNESVVGVPSIKTCLSKVGKICFQGCVLNRLVTQKGYDETVNYCTIIIALSVSTCLIYECVYFYHMKYWDASSLAATKAVTRETDRIKNDKPVVYLLNGTTV